jgi:hypothetical protein
MRVKSLAYQLLSLLNESLTVIAGYALLIISPFLSIRRSPLNLLLMKLSLIDELLLKMRIVILQYFLISEKFMAGLLKATQLFP